MSPTLPRGIYTLLPPTLSQDNTLDLNLDIDLSSILTHALHLASSGITGLILPLHKNTPPHSSHTSRVLLTRTLRTHLTKPGYSHIQLIAPCGAPTVRETLEQISEVKSAGADFALVLPPRYWVRVSTLGVPAVLGFLDDVARSSDLPVLVFDFPGVLNGLDVSGDWVIYAPRSRSRSLSGVGGWVSREVGLGRSGRIYATLSPVPYPSSVMMEGNCVGAALVSGEQGAVLGISNLVPRLCVHLLRLCDKGKLEDAQTLKRKLSRASCALSRLGTEGVKAAIEWHSGYGSVKKESRPLESTAPSSIGRESFMEPIWEVLDLERRL